jgi:hypothetical protein
MTSRNRKSLNQGAAIASLASLLALMSPLGCSLIFVRPLQSDYGTRDTARCTTDRLAPIVDTIFTVTNVASVVYVAGENNVTNKGTAVTVGLVDATLWLSSAIYGYSKTSECLEAQEETETPFRYPLPRVRVRPPAPPPSNAWAAPSVAPSAVEPPSGLPTAGSTASGPAGPAPAPAVAPAQQQDDDAPGARPPRSRP